MHCDLLLGRCHVGKNFDVVLKRGTGHNSNVASIRLKDDVGNSFDVGGQETEGV